MFLTATTRSHFSKKCYVFCILFILVSVISNSVAEEEDSKKQENTEKTKRCELPEKQKYFSDIVCKKEYEMRGTLNAFKEKILRKKYDRKLRKLFKGKYFFRRWHAQMGLTKEDSKGRIAVVFSLPSDCSIQFMNFKRAGLFSKKYFTRIKMGTKLFRKMSRLELGDSIFISGRFVPRKKDVVMHEELDFVVKIKDVWKRHCVEEDND